MITCQHARHLFDSYLDGELSASLQTELHAHRLNCSACQNELALLEACGDVIAMDRREPRLSMSFTDRIMAAQLGRRVPQRRRSFSRTLRLVSAPLAAAACLALMFSITAPGRHPRQAETAAKIESMPSEQISRLTGHPLTIQQRKDLADIPEASLNDLALNMLGRLVNARNSFSQTTQELGKQFANALPSEQAVARLQCGQNTNSAAVGFPNAVNDALDPSDPSYLIAPTAAPQAPEKGEGDGPAEVF